MANEKQGLLSAGRSYGQGHPSLQTRTQYAARAKRLRILALFSLFVSITLFVHNISAIQYDSWVPSFSGGHKGEGQCPQIDPIFPQYKSEDLKTMEQYLLSGEFEKGTIERLAGAVMIPSVSYDDLGVIGEDKRWDIFYEFQAYLKNTFPLVNEHLQLEVVNEHGLVYTWHGKDDKLKPMILMAHQDVVPVAESTINSWTHPPFSGHYDGKFIWGRGSSDCKNLLIAELEAVEGLLHANFQPNRTLVMSFGFDEEISGREGAGHLSKFLLDRYGKDGIAVILDEGASIDKAFGVPMAAPGTGEKGYLDADIIVRMPGGHSSIPPQHNGIGVMSELITKIEEDQYEPHLSSKNPFLGQLYCGAEHGTDFPKKLKKLLPKDPTCPAAVRKSKTHGKDKLALEASKMSLGVKFLMTTSVAVDVIMGGVKVNALPERTIATVNHRINVGSSSADVKDKLTHLAGAVAKKYNLTLHAFEDKDADVEPAQSIILKAHATTLEPAPVTPTTLKDKNGKLTPYAILSGTTRALYNTKDQEVIMSPGIMTGNTDTRYYWDLSRHIFRFVPGYDPESDGGLGNIHTVDERISVRAHINTVRWVSTWIRNIDEADF